MKFHTEGHLPSSMIAVLASKAYGIKDIKFKHAYEFDSRDLWLNNDFDFYIEQVLDSFWD